MDFERFYTYLTFSQLCAKASVSDVCLVTFEANKKEQIRGVSFHFKTILSKKGRVLNSRRITRFWEKCGERDQHADPI